MNTIFPRLTIVALGFSAGGCVVAGVEGGVDAVFAGGAAGAGVEDGAVCPAQPKLNIVIRITSEMNLFIEVTSSFPESVAGNFYTGYSKVYRWPVY